MEGAKLDPFGPERSLINVTEAEWKSREINVMSLVRSFLSQISPGQDLTKISLPSVLCHPFSMLELISHREMLLFHILFELDQFTDPLERFMVIVKWFISLTRSETMEKKPFNPVIGETHLCWVDNGSDDFTEFISEQVSHHPPVSAFFVRNMNRNISIEGAAWFGVKLSTNSATVTTSGPVTVTTNEETFELTKCVPDLNICNTVMPGKKYIIWNGEVKISCPQSGLIASIITEERYYRVNGIQGVVYHRDDPNKIIYKIDGVCGQKTLYWSLDKPKDKRLLIDHSQYKEAQIQYLPRHLRSEFDSLRLWVPVVDAIIKNDMSTADNEKKKIEAAQRIRQAEKINSGKQDEGLYFKRDPDSLNANWQFRYNISLIDTIKNGTIPESLQKVVPQDTTLNNVTDPQAISDTKPNADPESVDRPIEEPQQNLEGNRKEEPKSDQQANNEATAASLEHQGNLPVDQNTPEAALTDETDGVSELSDKYKNSKLRPTNGSEISVKSNSRDEASETSSKTKKKPKDGKIKKDKEKPTKATLNPQDILKTGYIKLRNPLKKWPMRYAILVEGKLIYYASQADAERENCRGIILLNNCYIKERHTKKDGFCIKIFNTLNHPIFSRQDLRGKPINKPLEVNKKDCLLRLKTTEEGKDWLRHLIKATPDFDHTKSLVEKDNDSDSSDGPDDADESESSHEDNDTPTNPIPHSNSNHAATPGPEHPKPMRTPSPSRKSMRIEDIPKTEPPQVKFSLKQQQQQPGTSQRKSLDASSSTKAHFMGPPRIEPPIKLTQPVVSQAEQKQMFTQLQTTLREDLNKLIDTKLDQHYKTVVSTKLDTFESRIAYIIRTTTIESRQLAPNNNHSIAKTPKPNNPIKHLLELTRKHFSLNAFLLLIIFYLLLTILWTINGLVTKNT